jgi:hypothetical protein
LNSFYEYNHFHVAKQQLSPQPLGLRGLMTSILLRDAIDVKVPAMGESVSEGTIAALLKKAGRVMS